MASNPPPGFPRVIPYLLYRDAGGAVEWLCDVFGFTVRDRVTDENGAVNHAELLYEDGMVMLGCPGAGHAQRQSMTYVYVDDVDAHYERARAKGARIVREIQDQFYGDRNYGAEDPEGHHWYFGTHTGAG